MKHRSVLALSVLLPVTCAVNVGGFVRIAWAEDQGSERPQEAATAAPTGTEPAEGNGTGTRAASPSRPTSPRPAARPKRPPHAHYVRLWHQPPAAPPSRTPEGRFRLVLDLINTGERIELSPQRDDGGFSDSDLERAAHALRDNRTDETTDIDPRVLDLAYRLQLHFAAKSIRVLSAYRVAHGHPSNHSRGRAIDLIVPGHRDEEVAAYARTIGFVGVGIYPTSGFIHLDSRSRSFFWVDRSGPGQRNRTRPVLGGLAAQADAKAIARGEKPPVDRNSSDDEDGDGDNDNDSQATSDGKVYPTSTATSPSRWVTGLSGAEGFGATGGGGGNRAASAREVQAAPSPSPSRK